jgi:hypothetical protein
LAALSKIFTCSDVNSDPHLIVTIDFFTIILVRHITGASYGYILVLSNLVFTHHFPKWIFSRSKKINDHEAWQRKSSSKGI